MVYMSMTNIYEQEQAKLFRGPTWNYVALEAEIPNPGDYKSTFVGDTPVVIARVKMGASMAGSTVARTVALWYVGNYVATPRLLPAFITNGALLPTAV